MDIITLALVTILGFVGGIFGTLVGGYALLIVPALIFLGLSPQEAIATDKIASLAMVVTGWSVFHKKKLINYKIAGFTAFFGMLGAVIGTLLLLEAGTDLLKKIISVATILLLFVIMLKKDAGTARIEKNIGRREWALGAILSFAIGIYGGFYGGGFATLQTYVLILLFGQTFIEAAGTRKILGFLVILVPAIILGLNGKIVYSVGLPLLVASSLGAYIGAQYSTKLGNVWIKRMFFAVVLAMAIKLLV